MTEEIEATEHPKKTSWEPQTSDEAVGPKMVTYQCLADSVVAISGARTPTMARGLDWTYVASSSGWVELIKC